ncbi:lyase family protein [Microbacterium murale]|uniref:3-carboxy-cis,cis-muconate cycloisomerase n=1 Tax=Microbacterium murale TaxID=1081040 RepID=A0ABU0P7G5_9MICO|nr:lyase family protein [Microbacterium murale]MDQ0643279.1 3-carboxy-cis,cis-muconate cycloisomerase [Microbacterium murale]
MIDEGLLSPGTSGHDGSVSDAVVCDALVTVEIALARAWGEVGAPPEAIVDSIGVALGWAGAGELAQGHGISVADLAAAGRAGGNPVIPLVKKLRAVVGDDAAEWVHRGATSQDIIDSALMLVAARAVAEIRDGLTALDRSLRSLAVAERDTLTVARTLTQHAVPTTLGARVAGWQQGVARALVRLAGVQLPAQLAGAGGTLAAFVERSDADTAARLVGAFAAELKLEAPSAPWHTSRWPVTELGDALVQTLDALGKMAADVATAARTEIGELAEGAGGGSSAMPQKQNPVAAVLIRSSALRAPQLGATLHLASALAVDERPDGAWHAEWQTLRELLRLSLGASALAAELIAGLDIDHDAIARNAAVSGGLILAERLSITLAPVIGTDAVTRIVAAASGGEDLHTLVADAVRDSGAALDVDELLDPEGYLGLAEHLASAPTRSEEER